MKSPLLATGVMFIESNSLFNVSGADINSLAGPVNTLGELSKNVDPYTNKPLPQLVIVLFVITPLVVTEAFTLSVKFENMLLTTVVFVPESIISGE